MIISRNGLKGFYTLEKFRGVSNEDGSVSEIEGSREKVAEFPNLILDSGLNLVGEHSLSSSIVAFHVGSGNSPPTVLDSGLDNYIASTASAAGASNQNTQTAVEPYYLSYQITKRFDEGDAAGNISEVGAGRTIGNTDLFSRALVLDSGGNPTTISIAANEYLDVTYELRIYPPSGDVTGSTVIDGITYDYTARACNIDSLGSWNFASTPDISSNQCLAYVGSIGDIFEVPSGTASEANSGVTASYIEDSHQLSGSVTWSLTGGNIGGIRSVRFKFGFTTWQVEFSAQGTGDPIPKDETKILSLSMSFGWARVV